jgi:hypothetical protein
MPGGGVERIGDPPLQVGLEQCRRQPQRLKAAPERADLIVVADPRKIVGVGARPRITDDRLGRVFLYFLRNSTSHQSRAGMSAIIGLPVSL